MSLTLETDVREFYNLTVQNVIDSDAIPENILLSESAK